jgi:hypothetical protein
MMLTNVIVWIQNTNTRSQTTNTTISLPLIERVTFVVSQIRQANDLALITITLVVLNDKDHAESVCVEYCANSVIQPSAMLTTPSND